MSWFKQIEKLQITAQESQPKINTIKELNIAIVGSGHYCATGSQPYALYGAVATNMGIARKNEMMLAPCANGVGNEPIMTVEIDGLDHLSPGKRMLMLAENALTTAMESFTDELEGKVLVCIVTPPFSSERGKDIVIDEWKNILIEADERLENAEFNFISVDEGASKALDRICNEIDEELWQSVLFLGVDSLVDNFTQVDLAMENRLMTVNASDGLVPGEGAACMWLQSGKEPGSEVMGYIKGIGCNKETNAGRGDTNIMTGLNKSISIALEQAKLDESKIKTIVTPGGAEAHDHIEWYQVTKKLWPDRLPEQDRLAMQVGEVDAPQPKGSEKVEMLRSHIVLGEIGAASLPMNMILAIARLDHEMPLLDQILVVDTDNYTSRGAVCIVNNKSTKQTQIVAA